ncbi:hypothetical protein WJX74_002305 [Apatococcus lobatus]|uniref:DUS-like FMN-binding domain-containing protein n=1 Tax=Apatococcus lobatus TaxID=904363 RepID=A0AAW1QCF3_9CHLO
MLLHSASKLALVRSGSVHLYLARQRTLQPFSLTRCCVLRPLPASSLSSRPGPLGLLNCNPAAGPTALGRQQSQSKTFAPGATRRMQTDVGLVQESMPSQLLSVAPMMDWTDVHYRQLARLMSRHTWLYTEMVVDSTLIHNPNTDKFLWFPPEQHPIVCQLGGSNPTQLAKAALMVARYGYDEINLNCGCPSDRVAGAGCFGAALMLQPETVAACAAAVNAATPTPLTIKCRLGVDSVDSYESLCRFVSIVSEKSGVTHFLIHARKCLLKGLNPHQNRTIPPLRYEWVWALKRDFPHLSFSLNGGVMGCYEAAAALRHTEVTSSSASDHRPSLLQDDHLHPSNLTHPQNGSASDPDGSAGAPGSNSLQHEFLSNGHASINTDKHSTSGLDQHEDPHHANSSSSGHAGLGVSQTSAARDLQQADDGPAVHPAGGDGCGAHSRFSTRGGSGSEGGLHGVMIGRAAYNNPWECLSDADRAVFGASSNPAQSRRQVLRDYCKYADSVIGKWAKGPESKGHVSPNVRAVAKPLLGMFMGQRGSRRWKQAMDEAFRRNPATLTQLLDETLHHIPEDVLDAPPKSRSSLPAFTLSAPLPDPITGILRSAAHATASVNPSAPALHHSSASGQHNSMRNGEALHPDPAAEGDDHASMPGQLANGQQQPAADLHASTAGHASPAHDTSQPDSRSDESLHEAACQISSVPRPSSLQEDPTAKSAESSQQTHALTMLRPAPDDAEHVLQPLLQDTVGIAAGTQAATQNGAGGDSESDPLLQHSQALADQGRDCSAAMGSCQSERQPQNWQAGIGTELAQDGASSLQRGLDAEQQVHKKARACPVDEAVAA